MSVKNLIKAILFIFSIFFIEGIIFYLSINIFGELDGPIVFIFLIIAFFCIGVAYSALEAGL